MTDHTPMSKVSRLDVISTGARRRWPLVEKQRIVAESYGMPRIVSATARRNGLSASQLFTWRRLAKEGRLAEADNPTSFVQAVIGCEPATSSLPLLQEHIEASENTAPCPSVASGRSEIVLVCGRRVRSTMTLIPRHWRVSWRFWSADDSDPERRSGVVGDRSHRYEKGVCEFVSAGAAGAAARPIERTAVLLSWTARRSFEGDLA